MNRQPVLISLTVPIFILFPIFYLHPHSEDTYIQYIF